MQLLFAAFGTIFLGLGVIGIFPLLAVACYARSSRRLFNWLLNHARFGPLIRE